MEQTLSVGAFTGVRFSESPALASLPKARASSSRLRPSVLRFKGARCMAPEEDKMTKRSPLDFPVEWVRPAPGRRPDIFPQFSPMKTPLPQPLPADPPEEDEEEEEEKEEEEEEQPEKEKEKPPKEQ